MPPLLSTFIRGHQVEIVETYLVFFVVAMSYFFPRLGSARFAGLERGIARFAQRRRLVVILTGVAALAARAIVLPILPVPVPSIHDEFEYLLMGDTFAHFRLTNPAHPMGAHLETFHVLQQPTYTGIVPPMQGLLLAAGKLIGGHPFAGVWLSVGLMCAAVCWMLQGWLPPKWALVGSALVVMRFAVFSYWSDSYWGGAIAAAAGALVLGAFPRIKRRLRLFDVLAMGAGLAILANVRPYEGLVFSLPVAVGLLIWMAGRTGPVLSESLKRVVLPLAMLMGLTFAAMGYYNWRVTGHPLRTAYDVSMSTVNPVPYFPWQSLRPIPEYQFKVFRDFYVNFLLPQYQEVRTAGGFATVTWSKIKRLSSFYFGAALGLPLLMALFMGGFRNVFLTRLRFLSIVAAVTLTGLFLEVQYAPHYAAPLACVFLCFVVQAMRYVRVWGRQRRPIGLLAMRAVPALCLISLALGAAQIASGYYITQDWPHSWYSVHIGNVDRTRLTDELAQMPGRQLVIVRYEPWHSVHDEWVFNSSDIDGSKTVWARDMDPVQNQELIQYFHDRRVWLLDPDKSRSRLMPYPGADEPSQAVAMEHKPSLAR
ncbi:MAG: hypothetical protein LAO19_08570 [Acidobacteriia bacterium]|nr:hypothetical protein [Terriglobia bacterium]